MATQQIPNQNNINAVIESIVGNINMTQQILGATTAAIANVVKKQKNIDADFKQFKKLKNSITDFCNVTNVIIKSLCTDLPDGKSLGDLLGRIEETDKKGTKQVKYTVVDAVAQIVNIIDSTFSVIEKISSFEMGFRKAFAIKRNIKILKLVVSDLLKDLTNVFTDLAANVDMNAILGSLVKEPDVTLEKIIKDVNQKNEYALTDKSITTKSIKQGKLGLLDVFEKTFGLVGLMVNLKVPNILVLRHKMHKVKRALKVVFNSLMNFTQKVLTNDAMKNLDRLGAAIMGDGNGGKKTGIYNIVTKLQMLIPAIKDISFSRRKRRRIVRAIRRIGVVFNKIIELVNTKLAGTLDNKDFARRLSIVNANIENIGTLIKNVAALSGPAFVVWTTSWLIRKAIEKIILIIDSINKLKDKDISNITIIEELNDVFEKLKDASKNIVITGLLAWPAIRAMFVIVLFVGALGLFIITLNWVSKLIGEVAEHTVKNIGEISKLIASLMIVGVAILLFALATPVIVWAITDNLTPFLMLLGGAIVLLFIMTLVAAVISKIARNNAIKVSINLIVIMGALLAAATVILVASLMARLLKDTDSIVNILIMIGGMIAISAIMIGLGLALSLLMPVMGVAVGGLGSLTALMALLVVAGLSIITLGSYQFDFGSYKSGKVTDGDMGEGTGAIGNVGKIFAFTRYIGAQLKDYIKDGGIKEMRKSKRLLRQVNRTVKQIVNIANRLNYLQTIKLNTSAITANVESIFTFIKDLDTKIQDFMKPEEAGIVKGDTTIKGILTNMVKGTLNGMVKRREMRQANRALNKVEKVVTTLDNIGEVLVSISEFKMEQPFMDSITNNVQKIFEFIGKLDEHIAAFMVADINPEDVIDAQKLSKKEWRKANRKLSKVEATIATLQGIGEALNTIKDLKLDAKAQEAIKLNVELALGSVESIAGIITGKSNNIKIDEDEIEKLMPLIDYIKALNNGFKGIDNTDPVKVEKNINNYIKFVDKVNSVQVEKVQKTAQMFEQMSKFSSSIKGDFDKLAESLSEKLLPVLEELKEVMGVLPEKIDNGFQNTSASIAAVNAAPTTDNVTAQINRENPNLTKEEVDAMVKTRINEKAQADANGVTAKMDELISLLKGFGGENVVVRTV